ncbi:MAG: acyl-CoA dehydrogenase family protein [Acidimicrobiia bacterium]
MPYIDDTSDLTSDQIAVKQQAHRFAADVLRPAAMELDALTPEEAIAPDSRLHNVFAAAYKAGYHVRGLPANLGGTELGPLESNIVGEEFGWGNGGLAISLAVSSMPFLFAAMSGNQDLIRNVVTPFAQDTEGRYIGCWPGTEPNHGSDTIYATGDFSRPDIHMDCVARKDGDEWVINGQKSAWVSNGTIATHALLWVGVFPERGMSGSGFVIAPLDLPGVSRGKPTDKIGQRALNQGELFFENVRIPSHYMVVQPEMMSGLTPRLLGMTNAGLSATFVGVARAAFEEALAYCEQRVQGGVPIANHQLVQRRLFDMFTKVEAARALSRKAQMRLQTGLPTHHYSMAAKVFCTQTAYEVASDAVQLHGGIGLVKGVLVEQLMRDARAATIEDGVNDILALVGARELFPPGILDHPLAEG